MDFGQPATLVAEAVYARMASADPERRAATAEIFNEPIGSLDVSIDEIEQALYASKIISYAQGFA